MKIFGNIPRNPITNLKNFPSKNYRYNRKEEKRIQVFLERAKILSRRNSTREERCGRGKAPRLGRKGRSETRCGIGACRRSQLAAVRERKKEGKRSLGGESGGGYIAYNGPKWPNYRETVEYADPITPRSAGCARGLPCTWIAPCRIIVLPLCLRLQESRDGGYVYWNYRPVFRLGF